MSYDLRIVAPGGIDAVRAAVALAAAGIDPDGDEAVVERDGVVAQFLVAGGEIGIGVTARDGGDGFREVLEMALRAAEAIGAQVLDEQLGVYLDRTNLDEALRAFG